MQLCLHTVAALQPADNDFKMLLPVTGQKKLVRLAISIKAK